MNSYNNDVAISAVPYDSALVADIATRLESRLLTPPLWTREAMADGDDGAQAQPSPLGADRSRIALVLHQRLWGRDATTKLDATVLRDRLVSRPGSVCVVTLDDEALPPWLDRLPRCCLATDGAAGIAASVIRSVGGSGGSVRAAPSEEAAVPETKLEWRDGPIPFVSQPRALSTLRRELDLLAAELQPKARPKHVPADNELELHALPNRLVLRLRDIGISFSWVPGRLGTVADGRLLVMQWEGATPYTRGVGALRFATAVRESVYRVDSDGPEQWWWRLDAPNGRACSTTNLAGEWLASAGISLA